MLAKDTPMRAAVPQQRAQTMKFGTEITTDGVRFRLWAPHADAIALRLLDSGADRPMEKLARGWFELEVQGAGPGDLYFFVLPDGEAVPDPASRFQPQDVHGPSEVIDPRAYPWTDIGWRGRPWEEVVLYELHVGAFTSEGTYAVAIDRLDHLVDLGVTAIELMPLADFPGRWNWGYDGVLHFAPDASYGHPDDLKALVDAAHRRGLMVFLDVVYNHFGPTGNYMSLYTPLLTDKHETPWGGAVNFDDQGAGMIRDFMIANARYWLNEFNMDGLRFDAIHAIQDNGPKHMLQDMAEQVRAATDGRHIHLVAENSHNHANWMRKKLDDTPWLYNAQWNDDLHHTLHTAATGEGFWYYERYAGRVDLLGRALAEGFAFQGEYSELDGETRGEPSAFLPATSFVAFIQNHDQIGNRPQGDRLNAIASKQACRALAATYLLCPQIPLVFMGEEWNAPTPFHYFSDVGDELADAIREGRAKEFENPFDLDEAEEAAMPDPMAEETFVASKLDWSEREQDEHAQWLSLYKQLLRIRHAQIIPRLFEMAGHAGRHEIIAEQGVLVTWTLGDGSVLTLFANLNDKPLNAMPDLPEGKRLWTEGDVSDEGLGPWSLVWALATDNGDALA